MKILCVGQASYDLTYLMSQYPEENTKNTSNLKVECGGGTASNPAYLLGKWGSEVAFAGVVGKDFYGEKVKKELLDASVDISYVFENKHTTVSVILANKQTGTRTIVTSPKEGFLPDFSLSFYPDILLMDGREYETSISLLKKYPKAISVLDAGKNTDQVYDLCQKVDYVICSKEFAENFSSESFETNKKTQIFEKVESICKKNLVITLEKEGYLYRKDGEIKQGEALDISASDSTGAGDFFHGAFVYGLSKGYSYEQCLKIASITASLSCQYVGSRFSVPRKEEVRQYIHEFI